MKYMGSKARIAKEILPIILKDRKQNQWYIELMAGGCNMIDKVSGNRIANDNNFYLIELLKKVVYENWIPEKISRELYSKIKLDKEKYPAYLVGWIGFNCSYSGKFFGGYAGETKTKINTIRDYQQEAINNILKQVENLKGAIFKNEEYYNLNIPPKSIVYADPPYKKTTGYQCKFDYDYFWNYIRLLSKNGHSVFVSEYVAPSDFICVWQKEVNSSLSANGKAGGNKKSIEKLFTINN